MSHISVIEVEIKDLKMLKKACAKLGLAFKESQNTYRWYLGKTSKCDHAIVDPDNSKAYELGVIKTGDSYRLETDFYNRAYGLQDKIGKECKTLINEYTKTVAIDQASSFAKANGWSVSEGYDENTNETIIKLRKY